MSSSRKPKNCIYIYPKGPNKGQRCGRPVDEQVDFVYCRLHFNMFCNRFYEGKDMGLVFPDAATEHRFKKICLDPKIMGRSKKFRDLQAVGKLPPPPVYAGPIMQRPGVMPKNSKLNRLFGNSPKPRVIKKSPPKKSPVKKKVSFVDQIQKSPKIKQRSPPPYPGISPVHCRAFLKNPTFNPVTGRSIKIGGPVYKKLEDWCKDVLPNSPPKIRTSRKTSEIFKSFEKLKQICDEWNKNRNIDPVTRKRIVPADDVYKQLVSRCSQFDKNIAIPTRVKTRATKPDAPQFQIVYDKKIYPIPPKIGQWTIGKKIGSGGFGTIYSCFSDSSPGVFRAIKIEHRSSGCLFYESHVYTKIKAEIANPTFIPVVYDRGIFGDLRYLVIETLQPLNYSPLMIPEIVKKLEKFAKIKRTHGDVKLDNIMRRQNGEIVLIDLGLSWPIKDETPKPCNIAGTPLFMSVNAHDGILTYANDLESLVYVVFDAIHKLPWESFKSKTKTQMVDIRNSKSKFRQAIVDKSDPVISRDFKLDEFPVLRLFAKYVFELKGMKYPDYDFIVSLFKK